VQKADVPDAADVDALFEEVGILQQIHHPNIMRLYEFYEDDNEYALVTEIVEGGELFDRIVELQHYSEKEARDLVAIFLQTLDFLHSNGIAHRDLKPENLLLATKNDDHHIKIADFGFAKHISQRLDTVCGTPGKIIQANSFTQFKTLIYVQADVFCIITFVVEILC
jgi:calcium/calmodulin-dependent protein kinase I